MIQKATILPFDVEIRYPLRQSDDQFRHGILAICQEARSPVKRSLSQVYHYQFSSISKAISKLAINPKDDTMLLKEEQNGCVCQKFKNTSP